MKKNKKQTNRNESAGWHQIDWRRAEEECYCKQLKIIEAWRKGEVKRMFKYQEELVLSFAARALAVRRVSTGGSKTAGIDGKTLGTPSEKYVAMTQLKSDLFGSKSYKPSGVRRV